MIFHDLKTLRNRWEQRVEDPATAAPVKEKEVAVDAVINNYENGCNDVDALSDGSYTSSQFANIFNINCIASS